MSEETTNIDDKEPDLSALDNVLFKYRSSSSYSHKKQRQEEEDIPCLDVEGACEIQPPSKSFLDEIQERAKVGFQQVFYPFQCRLNYQGHHQA